MIQHLELVMQRLLELVGGWMCALAMTVVLCLAAVVQAQPAPAAHAYAATDPPTTSHVWVATASRNHRSWVTTIRPRSGPAQVLAR